MILDSNTPNTELLAPKRPQTLLRTSVAALAVLILGAICIYHFVIGPFGFDQPVNEKLGGVIVEVKSGMSAKQIANALKGAGVISSASLFSGAVSVFGDSKRIVAGYYLFKRPLGILEAESRIRKGEFGLERIKLTFPEGFTTKQIGERLAAASPIFDKDEFMELASTSSGYLFPDTYFFLPTDTAESVIKRMRDTFINKTDNLFASSTHNTEDIVTMASILEKEVQDPKDMKIVSGILWKRLKIGMALQVDSAMITYDEPGFPDEPISNPGLNALTAAAYPQTSPYLYFLTDKEGKVYYARTFEEHKANKAKYL